MMDALQRAVPVPQVQIVVHRTLRRQVLRQSLPLASRPKDIEDPVQHLTHVHRALATAMSCRWDHGLHNRPLGIAQIARVTKAIAVRGNAVFGLPHRALSRESSAPQLITSDSPDSRTSRSGP